MINLNRQTVLFDNTCILCIRWANFLIRRDKKHMIHFLPLESKEGHDAIAKTILKDQEFDSIVLISGVKVYLKSEAVIKILDTIGGPWRLFKIGFLLPRPVRDWLYDILARNRYRIFGKQDQCMVPGPDLKNRFLE